jgi:type II secretory pathway component PulC
MKNKKMTYLLGAAVVIVWAIIIYRVFDASGSGDDSPMEITGKPQKEAYNDFEVAKDTTRLLLNYRDPFGLVKQKDTAAVNVKNDRKSVSPPAKPVVNWGFIKYSGYILNPGSKKTIALISINGKSAMLAEGETIDNVKLLKNMRDSVKVTYNGQVKFIRKNR